MTMQFRTTLETKGINDFGQIYSDQIYNATLTAVTNTLLTVPGGGIMGGMSSYDGTLPKNTVYAVIRVSEGDDVWVAVNSTAAAPVGATFAQATSEIVTGSVPICRFVKVGDIINFFTSGASTAVSVAFYALPG